MALTLLPAGLETTATESGALLRRRGVPNSATLLRLAFAYAFSSMSLRSTVAWAAKMGIARLSDVALLQRLRHAAPWLGQLLTQKLAERVALPGRPAGELRRRRLLLADATVVSRPGSTGTDYRIHLGFNLEQLCINAVELTDAHGGETLARYPVGEDDVVVGDRCYGHRRGIVSIRDKGAHLIVRVGWQNLPLQRPDGCAFDLLAVARQLGCGEVGDFAVCTAPDPKQELPAVAGRLIMIRKHPQAAEEARRKLRRESKKKGHTPDERSLEAAGYVFLFTTLTPEELDAPAALALYRFRWQIELAFKRMKSVLELDEMAAKDPDLCRSFLLAKLLGALLIEDLTHRWESFSPWGYGSRATVVSVEAGSDVRAHLSPSDSRAAPAAGLAESRPRNGSAAPQFAATPIPPGSGGPSPTDYLPLALCLN